jgi:integrase
MPNYLKRRRGRKAWYFQIATPKDLQGRVGATMELSVGIDHATALEASGRALRVARGMFDLMRRTPPNPDPAYERRKWRLTNHINEILDIKPSGSFTTSWNGSKDDIEPDSINQRVIENVNERTHKRMDVDIKSMHKWMTIPEEEKRRNPSKSENTLDSWVNAIKKFIDATGIHYVEQVDKDAVIKFRDYLQETCTTKGTFQGIYSRLRTVYRHAHMWGWHDNEPRDMFESRYISGISVGKRQPKGIIKENKVTDISPADDYYRITKYDKAAPSIQKNIVTWWIMRYTCAHIGEAEGIVWEDIDFDKKTIRIQANSVRELKTEQRGRELPLLEPLYELLLKHKRHTNGITGSIHGLPDNIDRRKLGKVMKSNMYKYIHGPDGNYSPKKARDYGNTVIKANYKGNPETLYAINGHKRQSGNATAAYGDITLEAKREALSLLLDH